MTLASCGQQQKLNQEKVYVLLGYNIWAKFVGDDLKVYPVV
jgi:hypothetical protein